jgi:hypothetical protein
LRSPRVLVGFDVAAHRRQLFGRRFALRDLGIENCRDCGDVERPARDFRGRVAERELAIGSGSDDWHRLGVVDRRNEGAQDLGGSAVARLQRLRQIGPQPGADRVGRIHASVAVTM